MPTIEETYESYWTDPTHYEPADAERIALLKKHLAGLPKGSRVLDAGCGLGEFCAFFAEQGFVAEGIDISHQVISHASKRYPSVAFHAGEIQTMLPARAGSFDCVFSSEVIEHLFDVGGFLESINRLLKPGGLFIVTTPYHGLAKNIAIALRNYSKHYDPLWQHIRFFDHNSLNLCLTKYGFEGRVWTGFGRRWPFWKSFFVVSAKVREA